MDAAFALQDQSTTKRLKAAAFFSLPEEIWLLVLGFVDETTKAICMGVCPEWRSWVLRLTRSVSVPRLFEEDLACSVSLLMWQRDVLGRPLTKKTCAYAAKGGDLQVLQHLRAIGIPWDKRTCSFAAMGGRLEILQYARANGCPWSEYTCRNAASRGHLDILKYARVNGCPWDLWTCTAAAEGGHPCQRLPLGCRNLRSCCKGRPPVHPAVRACQWLPLG